MIKKLEKLIKKYAKKYEGLPIALSGGIDSSLLAALIKPKFAVNVEIPDDKLNESHYAKKVAKHLGIDLYTVKLDTSTFKKDCEQAFKAIGKPIPHFNIFPLYQMYQTLKEKYGVKKLVLGDGPDETMCGYARDLIYDYLMRIYDFKAFQPYHSLIEKFVDPTMFLVMAGIEQGIACVEPRSDRIKMVNGANIELKRPEMDDMSNGLAKHFGIKNLRPYQDNKEIDNFMFNLPPELKIHDVEYGKYALRLIAEKYLPKEIAWRKVKVGGPVFPVNKFMSWDKIEGEFGKIKWLAWQRKVLNA